MKRLTDFIAKAFCEQDGTPSSARLVMGWESLISSAAIILLVIGVLKSDKDKATVILTWLPAIIAALAAWVYGGYGLNRMNANKD